MSASSHRLSASTRSLSLRSKASGTIITISLSGIGVSSKFIVRTRRATGRSTTVELTKPKIALRSRARQRIRKKRGINRRLHRFHRIEEVWLGLRHAFTMVPRWRTTISCPNRQGAGSCKASRFKFAPRRLAARRSKFTNFMGHYKGRVKLTQRRRRFAKNQRVKALAAAQKEPPPPHGTSEQK